MLNPNDISSMKFDKVMGRGYRAEEVDNFLRQIANDFAAVLEEKQEIEQKMIVLADKLEEYKRDEESMRSALIGAQKLGDSVIRDAKAKASAIIDDAGGRAQLLLDNARKTIEREQSAYLRMQREVAAFKSKLQHLYKQHLEMISAIPASEESLIATEPEVDEVPPTVTVSRQQVEEPSRPVSTAPPVIDTVPVQSPPPAYDTAQSLYEENMSMPEEDYGDDLPPVPEDQEYDLSPSAVDSGEYSPEDYDPQPQSPMQSEKPQRDSKFGTLKFGREYSISRTDRRKK